MMLGTVRPLAQTFRFLGGGAGCSVPSRTTDSWVKSG